MYKVLVIQHVPFEGLGWLDTWFQMKAVQYRILRFFELEEEQSPPSFEEFDALIILGGPMGVSDAKDLPWLDRELKYISHILHGPKKPILGICLGSQILAHLLGGQVRKNNEKEIGWYPISLTPEGRGLSFFEDWPEDMVVFHWHQDMFTPPKGSLLFATSAACSHQGFVYQGHIIGFQFHLEITPEITKRLVESCAQDIASPGPYVATKHQILSGFAPYAKVKLSLFSFLDKWVQSV